MKCISVAFVDDHPLLISGVEYLFGSDPEFQVVGSGTCAADALKLVKNHKPDVIVVDLNMPGNVFATFKEIAKNWPNTKVLVFTAVMAIEHAITALEAGAKGYVLKGSSKDELIQAIRSVIRGETYITPSFVGKVVAGMQTASLRRATKSALQLSSREEQVLRLLLRGMTNKEIADAMSLSDKTIKHYMTALMQRLNVRNRIEVVLAAQELGMTLPAPRRLLMN